MRFIKTRFWFLILTFFLSSCEDRNADQNFGSLSVVFNSNISDTSSSLSDRLINNESIARLESATITIGSNSPVSINLNDTLSGNSYTATDLPVGPIQVTVELYSKGVLNIDELRFSQTRTVVIESGQTITSQFDDWTPDLSNMYFYESFEGSVSDWVTGNSNPFSITTSESRHGGSSAESGIVNTSNTVSYLRTNDNVWINNIPSTSPQEISIVYYYKSTCSLDIRLGLGINNGSSSPVILDTHRTTIDFWTRKEVQFSPNALANITSFYFDILAVSTASDCKCYIDYVQVY